VKQARRFQHILSKCADENEIRWQSLQFIECKKNGVQKQPLFAASVSYNFGGLGDVVVSCGACS